MFCHGIAFLLAAVIALVPLPALARDAATLRTDIGKFIATAQEHVQKDDVSGNTAVGDTKSLKYWEAEIKKIQENIKKIFRENIDRELDNFHYDINNLTSAEEKTKLMDELKAQFESYWKGQIDKFRAVATMMPGQQAQQQQQAQQHPPQPMPQPGGGNPGGRGGSVGSSGGSGGGSSSAPPPRRSSRRSVRLDSSEEEEIKDACKRKYKRDRRAYKKCWTEKKSRALRKKKEAEKRRSRRRGRH